MSPFPLKSRDYLARAMMSRDFVFRIYSKATDHGSLSVKITAALYKLCNYSDNSFALSLHFPWFANDIQGENF